MQAHEPRRGAGEARRDGDVRDPRRRVAAPGAGVDFAGGLPRHTRGTRRGGAKGD